MAKSAVNRRTFKRYTLEEYITQALAPAAARVRFSEVHVHGTWKPTIAQFRKDGGLKIVQAMWRFHTGTRGWSDIGQHATVDPDGYVWEGRSLLVPPASAEDYNDSDNDGVHPFMFEMVGNFDRGCERLEGAQLRTALGLCRAVMTLMGRGTEIVHFHRDYTSAKTCPGSGVDRAQFIAGVVALGAVPTKPITEVKPKMNVKDAEKVIAHLSAAWGAAKVTDRPEIHRLADEVRKVAGISVGK
ncbi:peptidoglycan recognition protein family protein [Cohnella silvisoli]|uniref:Peptidoglycan recognition family protein n=1 Tax=Cohnella silvisoli TaxID=2873699 RepID=A0ABV1KYU4_9BACL|nr:peptidoglycan recognition family protein [Cohnella silvisoli]MCD9024300.1 peptidoglycan recognition protein family protein [Cohnella silvisoli]